ncbi:hypothetical protein Celaphus_00012443 [Cervus elaphus hippelaphus]|uniref:Uncharacterized protein n=1 Tax=Cervus elaphus hippelaphus TaxID=46360 RepID=A0A212CK68_CEREH|nr:hypothetical protein Celaphus_00012443 [Cervus elaphus hippelaphus]
MAVTFQMLAVQQSTSHAIHSWHSRRPSCQRRPDSSCTRLSGMTRAATSTSEMAMDATRLCGTRWNVRTRRMVASTSRFQANVAATRKPSKRAGCVSAVVLAAWPPRPPLSPRSGRGLQRQLRAERSPAGTCLLLGAGPFPPRVGPRPRRASAGVPTRTRLIKLGSQPT